MKFHSLLRNNFGVGYTIDVFALQLKRHTLFALKVSNYTVNISLHAPKMD